MERKNTEKNVTKLTQRINVDFPAPFSPISA